MEKEQVDCIHVLQTLAHLYALILIGQESIKKGWKVVVRRASHYKSNKRALPSEVAYLVCGRVLMHGKQ